jgi:hypothetical protein
MTLGRGVLVALVALFAAIVVQQRGPIRRYINIERM